MDVQLERLGEERGGFYLVAPSAVAPRDPWMRGLFYQARAAPHAPHAGSAMPRLAGRFHHCVAVLRAAPRLSQDRDTFPSTIKLEPPRTTAAPQASHARRRKE
jgi:hypothetical protein